MYIYIHILREDDGARQQQCWAVYLYETDFNLNLTRRNPGRAPVGELFNRVMGSQRGRNINSLVAVRKDVGVLNYHEFGPAFLC